MSYNCQHFLVPFVFPEAYCRNFNCMLIIGFKNFLHNFVCFAAIVVVRVGLSEEA